MFCANCEQWARRCTWISQRLAEADPRRRLAYVCSRDSELYWLAVCRPNCELNAVRHASFELEVAAMASGQAGMSFSQVHTLADAVCGLQAAWAKYLADDYYTKAHVRSPPRRQGLNLPRGTQPRRHRLQAHHCHPHRRQMAPQARSRSVLRGHTCLASG